MTEESQCLNKFCPNSGKPVKKDSHTVYRGCTVGFCNPQCRDDFAKDTNTLSKAKTYFDTLIKECCPEKSCC